MARDATETGTDNVQAATGDQEKPWTDYLSLLKEGIGIGSDIYKTATGEVKQASAPTANASGSAAPAAPANSWTAYLPWAIGGVVLLVVLGFVFRKS